MKKTKPSRTKTGGTKSSKSKKAVGTSKRAAAVKTRLPQKATRPDMPASYGVEPPGDFMSWNEVEEKLAKARNYWVGTTRPDGRPHNMPVWGVWLNGMLVFSTDRRTRKARNIDSNPAIVVHLESGDDVAIAEGSVAVVSDAALIKKIDSTYEKKYGMKVSTIPGDVVIYAMRPKVVFAWREKDFNKFATRWSF